MARQTLASLRQEVAKLQGDLNQKDAEIKGFWTALQQEANERDWCDEYDEFAKANGGPTRFKEYEVLVVVREFDKDASSWRTRDRVETALIDAEVEYTDFSIALKDN